MPMSETIPTKTVTVDYDFEQDLLYRPVKTRSVWGCEMLPGQGNDGYGTKIVTHWKIKYEGIERRIYCTQISNAGSWWFMVAGRKISVS